MKHRQRRQFDRALVLYAVLAMLCVILVAFSPGNCGSGTPVVLRYGMYSFWISLHDPDDDRVVSKEIKETLQYSSVQELHAVCTLPHVRCNSGRQFVEVGSAVGMVSLYAASRGMRVVAFDPLPPNVRRVKESLCLNCRTFTQWDKCANFQSDRFSVYQNLVGAQSDAVGRSVQSEHHNLAATMRGGGSVVVDNVTTVTIDQSVIGPIELLLLTCQGAEYEALLGASMHLAARKINNVIWRRHHAGPEYDVKATQIVHLLWSSGFHFFYDLEGSRSEGSQPRLFLSDKAVLEYVNRNRAPGEHPNILASMGVLG